MRRAALAAALLLAATAARAERGDLRAQLRAGRIVVRSLPGSGIRPARAMATLEAPAEAAMRVLADVARYREFVPHVTGSRKLGDGRYELRAALPWPVPDVRVVLSVTRARRRGGLLLRWRLTEGTLDRFEGFALVQPWGKRRSLLTYQMLVDPRLPAPDAFMTYGLRKAVAKVVAAIRERVAAASAQR